MSERQFTGTGHSDDQIYHLSRTLTQELRGSGAETLDYALNGIVSTEPFLAAGVYSSAPESGECHWIQFDAAGEGNSTLELVLDKHTERLADASRGGEPLQVEIGASGVDCPWAPCYFVSVSAGQISGSWAGTGYLTRREITVQELATLESFSRLVGIATENARMKELLNQDDENNHTSQLIGLIAHELRTPLTGMRGNIQLALMSNRKGQHDRVPDRLEAAISAVDHLAALVQKLLDVSRIERGSYPFHTTRADLRVTLTAAIENASSLAEAALRIRLTEGDPVEHLHDQNAMQHAISYLLQTVTRYISDGGEISISVSGEQQERRIEIAYPGTELSPTDQTALSKPLHESYEHRDESGGQELALELAFSRGIVMRHQGSIEFETSETPPGTQLITVRFPVEQV